jgi:hypothetical protein
MKTIYTALVIVTAAPVAVVAAKFVVFAACAVIGLNY